MLLLVLSGKIVLLSILEIIIEGVLIASWLEFIIIALLIETISTLVVIRKAIICALISRLILVPKACLLSTTSLERISSLQIGLIILSKVVRI